MKIQGEKMIAGVATVLLFGSLIGSMFLFRSNSRLNDGLSEEMLRNESLMTEKVALTKEIDKLKKDYALLASKNAENEINLSDLRITLQDKDQRIAQLSKEINSIKDLRQQVAQLQQLKSELEKQLNTLLAENSSLKADYESLQEDLLALKSENATLAQSLDNMRLSDGDNYLVQSFKGNKKNRLTINSGKSKKISVSFDLPKEVMADLKFQVTTPGGKLVKEDDSDLRWIIPGDHEILTASLDGIGGDIKVTRRVEMTYEPGERMEKGIYSIAIYNGKFYVGSCQLELK